MSRTAARLAAGAIALSSLACADSHNPLVATTRAATGLSAAAAHAPSSATIDITDIPALAGPSFFPAALNDRGEIVGRFQFSSDSLPFAFRWQSTHGVQRLSLPGSSAAGVNDAGEAAITLLNVGGDTTAPASRAGRWRQSGRVDTLPSLSATLSVCEALGINDRGVTVGDCFQANASLAATVWSSNGHPRALGAPSPANAISDAGFIVAGDSLFTPAGHAVPLPGGPAVALAVNDSGWAAGITFGNSDAAAWLVGQALHDLGNGQAVGISDDGIVVGTTNAGFAFLWTKTGGVRLLPGLDAGGAPEPSSAIAINAHHQILGQVSASTGQRTVIWTIE